jgi:hypothetical protein
MPNPHGLSALILKGDWCGSELSVTVAERTDGASGTDQDDVAGQKSVFGHEKICRSIDRGQLNGDPVVP